MTESFSQSDSSIPKQWTMAQVWFLVSNLVKYPILDFNKVRMSSVFNGNETAILDLQCRGLITVIYDSGIPIAIIPGKPVHNLAFSKLTGSQSFSLTLSHYYNKEFLKAEISSLDKYENELRQLGFFDLQNNLASSYFEKRRNYTSAEIIKDTGMFVYDSAKYLFGYVLFPITKAIRLVSSSSPSLSKKENLNPQQQILIDSVAPQLKPRILFLLNKIKSSQDRIETLNTELAKSKKYISTMEVDPDGEDLYSDTHKYTK
ncbi:Mitochondrial escape protein 2 [Smittium mucronatum]|uniref:Mitochondrial escape protein 2 n=1 Tax=Smittium mucronatum TaxID=133383 RepID=A0A1R0GVT9_9FUNG|nr:Mitochondrial escape protein 2 [Smittium mucronatum]